MYSIFQKVIFSLLVTLIAGYFGTKFFLESDFEKLDKTELDLPKWSNDNSGNDSLYKAIQEEEVSIKDIYSSLSERYIFYSHTDDYFIVGTGYNTLDDGLWFFATPTYTRLLVIEKETHKVYKKILLFKNITNAKLIEGEIYFRYDGPILWELATNFYRLEELDSEVNKLGKTSL
jgi:hypothetical protein